MTTLPVPSSSRILGLIAASALLIGGCGGVDEGGTASVDVSTIKVHHTARGALVPRLGARCFDLQTKLEKRVHEEKARPVTLSVRRSPLPVTPTKGGPGPAPLMVGTSLDGRALAAALRADRLRAAFVVGLSGSGKSAFSRTLEALVCDDMPAVHVDMLADVQRAEATRHSPNGLLAAAARSFGMTLPPDADAGAALTRGLAGKRWLLIADSMDAVPLGARPPLLKMVRDAIKKVPSMRLLLLTRPPVFKPAFSLPEVAGVIHLRPQSCDQVDATVGAWIGRDSRLEKYNDFAASYRLNRKVKHSGGCSYRQVVTWRDLAMASDLVRHLGRGTLTIDPQHFDASKAGLYRLWITTELEEVLKRGKVDSGKALVIIDRMLKDKASYGSGAWPSLDPRACQKIANAMAMTGVEERCRHLFRSRIFGPRGGDGRYRFVNRSVRDWFVARGIAARVKAAKTASCAVISDKPERYESSDVPAFLLGMPGSRACLADTLRVLCKARVDADVLATIVDRGLPLGKARPEVVGKARATLKAGQPIDACALDALKRIPTTAL